MNFDLDVNKIVNYTNKTKKDFWKKYLKNLNKTKKKKEENKQKLVISYVGFEKDFESNLSTKQLQLTNEKVKKEFVKDLLTPFAPDAIKPNNNFYNFINYMWLKNIRVKETLQYLTQIDVYRLLQNKTQEDLYEIVLNYIKNGKNKIIAKNLKNLVESIKINSFYNNPPKELLKKRLNFTKKIVENFLELSKDKKNIFKFLALLQKNALVYNSGNPFFLSVKSDKKDSKVMACYFEKYTFTIRDLDVYVNDGAQIEYKENFKNKYMKMLKKIFEFYFGKNNKIDVENVFKVEQKILEASKCKILKEGEFGYNKINSDDALKNYKFNWKEYCHALGYNYTPNYFIISSVNYLKCVTELLINEWNSEEWKPFWLFHILKILFWAFTTQENRSIFWEFMGKFQQGSKTKYSINLPIQLYNALNNNFYNFSTQEYVKTYFNQQIFDYVTTMANELKIVFIRILKRNSWLTKATKNYAIKKVESLKFQFVKPEKILNDANLTLSKDFFTNLDENSSIMSERIFKLAGKQITDYSFLDFRFYPPKIITSSAFMVNAVYIPTSNTIFIPLALMQSPFVDLNERGLEYNLAYIGFIIAHELSHALDNTGRFYDIDGNLKNWWSDKDLENYLKIEKDIIEQYKTFAARDDILYDPSISIGENIADISGLAICEEYLRDYQEHYGILTPNRSLSFRQFYTNFTIHLRQKIPQGAYKDQINTNPHPPDVYRVNVPLSRSEVFRATYGIKEGDGMFWKNTKTVW
jgi:putative endopeptidase